MNTKNSKKFLFIITGVFAGIVLILSLILFNFAAPTPTAIQMIFGISISTAVISALILTFVISTRYKVSNKINGGDKTSGYYFKRICFTVVCIFLMSTVISEAVGMFVNAIVGGMRYNMIGEGRYFLQGFIVKAPLFLIYLALVWNLMSQQGYKDANRKVFNFNLKILSVAIAVLLLIPGAVSDSTYGTQRIANLGGVNIQAVFSANQDTYIREDIYIVGRNPDFNIVLTAFTVLLAGVIQVAVAMFAYWRGKQEFLKKRLNPAEVETDEKC